VHRVIVGLILGLGLGLLALPIAANVSLGGIDVRSFLNQPLQAQIPAQGTALADDTLEFRLASEEAYRRAGLVRGAVPADLEIRLQGSGSNRQILLTTQRPVRDPYVGILLEARWSSGRVLREYVLLLDPPVSFAPAQTVPPARSPPEPTARRPDAVRPDPRRSDTAVTRSPAAAAPAGERALTYQVRRGDTLLNIVRQQGYVGVTDQQALLAFLEANPQAFTGGNVNRLRADVELTIPAQDQVARQGAQQAREAVQRQVVEWRDASQPPTPAARAEAPVPQPAAAAAATDESAVAVAADEPAPADAVPEPAMVTDESVPADAAPESLAAAESIPASADSSMTDTPLPLEDPAALDTESAGIDHLAILGEATQDPEASRSTQIIEEALLSQQVAMNELREEMTSLRADLLERDRLLSVVSTELAQLERRMREQQADSGLLRGETMPLHERIVADRLVLSLVAGLMVLFLLLLLAVFRSPRRPVAAVAPTGGPPAPVDARRAASDPALTAPKAAPTPGGTRSGNVASTLRASAIAGAGGSGATAQTVSAESTPATELVEHPDNDLLADVDLYLAYGMNDQAIAALIKAIEAGHDAKEVRLRLLEAYAANADGPAVQATAAVLRADMEPNDPMLERVIALETPFAAPAEPAALTPPAKTQAPDVATAPERPAPSGSTPAAVGAASGASGSRTGATEVNSNPTSADPASGKADTPSADGPGSDGNALDFEVFDIPATATDASEAKAPRANDGPDLLHFDLDEPGAREEPAAAASPEDAPEPSDASGAFDELTLSDPDPSPAAPDPYFAGAEGDTGDSDHSENGMKLSLAEAFAEMGDQDGALALLAEILPTATDAQKDRVEQIRRQIEGTEG